RLQERREAEGLLAVRRLADHLHLRVVDEHLRDVAAVVGGVVHHEESDRRLGSAHFALAATGFRYTRSSFKCNSSKAVDTFNSDSAWPSKSTPPGRRRS